MLSKQPDCFNLQKLWNLLGISSPSEGWSVDKVQDERYRKDCEPTCSTAGQNRVSDNTKEGNEEAYDRDFKLEVALKVNKILRALSDWKILRINCNIVNINLNISPKTPGNNDENGHNSYWNENLNNDPECTFPARVVMIPFIERSCDRFKHG